MRRGDHAQVQRMFRARIGAQAFTVCAIVAGGAYYGADREKRKELIKLEAQQRAEERHQKWLHELEVRDEEEKQLKEHLKRRRERVEARKIDEQDKQEPAAALPSENSPGPEGETKNGSGGVMGALASAGGWFGTGKKPEGGEKPDDTSKK
ncbi:hypothetical protein BX600DRAFT_449210 [Xylariales sp. PMI_506]|nr:hypothetical protein BX600DRAFT_449210 [Xylariales sp. PMI_506]